MKTFSFCLCGSLLAKWVAGVLLGIFIVFINSDDPNLLLEGFSSITFKIIIETFASHLACFLLVTFNILLFLCYSFCASRVCWTNSTRFLSMPPLWIYFPSGMCTDMCFVKVTVFLSLYNSISLSIFCDADLIDMSIFGVADLMDTDSLGFCLLWDIVTSFSFLNLTDNSNAGWQFISFRP